MSIQAIVEPYEILIRFTGGQPSGYHYKTLETVTDGQRVYSANESEAMPVEGEAVQAVLGEALQSALLRISDLEAQVAALTAEIGAEIAPQ